MQEYTCHGEYVYYTRHDRYCVKELGLFYAGRIGNRRREKRVNSLFSLSFFVYFLSFSLFSYQGKERVGKGEGFMETYQEIKEGLMCLQCELILSSRMLDSRLSLYCKCNENIRLYNGLKIISFFDTNGYYSLNHSKLVFIENNKITELHTPLNETTLPNYLFDKIYKWAEGLQKTK